MLWVDGEPRWLASHPEGESFAYSVVAGGRVLGTTPRLERTYHWIYSIESDTYEILKAPTPSEFYSLDGMNARGDITGDVWDEKLEQRVPFIWPVGGQPRPLPTPDDLNLLTIDDITDDGLIIARIRLPDWGSTSYLWESWDTQPIRLPGVQQDRV